MDLYGPGRPAIVGIDIAEKTFRAVILEGKGRTFENNLCGFRKFAEWLEKAGLHHAWVCMEHTNKFWKSLAFFLNEAGHLVSVINPSSFSSYAEGLRRGKSDDIDGRLLGAYCRDFKPRIWIPPSEAEAQLTELTRARKLLQKHKLGAESHLATLEFEDAQELFREHIKQLETRIERIESMQEKVIENCEQLRTERERWMEILSVKKHVSNTVLAEVGSLTKFTRYAQLRRFAGLDSIRNQSGTSLNSKPHTSKRGSKLLRAVLNMAAMNAMQHNPRYRRFAERLYEHGKIGAVVKTAVANKILLTMWALSRHGTRFNFDHVPDWIGRTSALTA